MVRAHTYPLLAAITTISLLTITVLLIPQAVKTHTSPGKLNDLKAVEHC